MVPIGLQDSVQTLAAVDRRDLDVKSLSRHVTYPWEPKTDRCSNALRPSGQCRHCGAAPRLGRCVLRGSRSVSCSPCSRSKRAPFTRSATMSESPPRKVLLTTPRFIACRRAGPSQSRRSDGQPPASEAVRPVESMGWLASMSISLLRVWDTRPCARTAVPARAGSIGMQNANWRFLFIQTFARTFTECSVTR